LTIALESGTKLESMPRWSRRKICFNLLVMMMVVDGLGVGEKGACQELKNLCPKWAMGSYLSL
jgi:hypothetical protein